MQHSDVHHQKSTSDAILPRILKGFNDTPLFKHIRTGALILGILILAFWIRIQGVDRLPDGQFTEPDAYLYYKQAQTIAEQGYLPARDMDRWLPLGRDNTQLLSLYAYAIAFTHKVFPWWSFYQIQLYLPVLCFTLGLGVLFLFLNRCYGVMFAFIVSVILATLPGSIERSASGFGDRDAWCWMFGVLAVISYLWKEQIAPGWRRWLATALSGFVVFLGGMSWEAFGVFVLIILSAEIWRFCSTDTEHHLKEYLLYLFMFVPWLYLISPAYHSGYGFAKHLFALTLAPPIAVFALRGTRYLLLKHIARLRPHARKLAGGLTLIGIITALCYLFFQADSLATTTFAFRENRLMRSVGELFNPTLEYWGIRYGTIFGIGSIGLVCASGTLWTRKNTLERSLNLFLSLLLLAFIIVTFGNRAETSGDTFSRLLFVLIVLTLGIAASRHTAADHKHSLFLIMLAWFLFWVSLASRGKRYDFFTGVPFAFGTAWLLWLSPKYLIQKLKDLKILNPHPRERHVTASLTILVCIGILFWGPLGGHVTRAMPAATQMRSPIPGKGHLREALAWIKSSMSQTAVLAAQWDFGTQLNVFSRVKTITDPDHYLPHWIPLYYRHVFCAQSEPEALEFLKTHEATHLMLTEHSVMGKSQEFSFIGSDLNNDRHFRFFPLQRKKIPIGAPYRLIPQPNETPLAFIELTRPAPRLLSMSIQFKDGSVVEKEIAYTRSMHAPKAVALKNGGILLFFNTENLLYNAYYVPSVGWNSLAVKLFFRGEHSTAFVPVYPVTGDAPPKTKIWEIHYPPDIQTNPKYLKTGFPEIDKDLDIQ